MQLDYSRNRGAGVKDDLAIRRHYHQFGGLDEHFLAAKEAGVPVGTDELWTWEDVSAWTPDVAQVIWSEYQRLKGKIPIEVGYVYLVHGAGTGFYKIGKAIQPGKRLAQFSPKMPFDCELIDTRFSYFPLVAEKMLHNFLSKHRAKGEWFELESIDSTGGHFLGVPDEVLEFAYLDQLSWRLKDECYGYHYSEAYGPCYPKIGPLDWDSGHQGMAQLDIIFSGITRALRQQNREAV